MIFRDNRTLLFALLLTYCITLHISLFRQQYELENLREVVDIKETHVTYNVKVIKAGGPHVPTN